MWSAPNPPIFPHGNISVFGALGAFPFSAALATGVAVYPTANKVFYIPIRVLVPTLVTQLYLQNGAPFGNIDLGVYTKDGTRKVSTGSTAGSGTNVPQIVNVTDTLLAADAYYFAVTVDNTTATIRRATFAAELLRSCDVRIETTVSFGLPATANLSTAPVDAYLPSGGLIFNRSTL